MAYLVPSLARLRTEFNQLNPGRDKASDGWIGDAEHQANPTSDHNPDERGAVHAIDVDNTGPWPALSAGRSASRSPAAVSSPMPLCPWVTSIPVSSRP